MVEVFHEHIPAHRISSESEVEVLKSLIARIAGWSETEILHSYLNKRRGGPEKPAGPIAHVTYPEEGVIRRYLSSSGVTAWSDSVFSPNDFRNVGGPVKAPNKALKSLISFAGTGKAGPLA